MGGQKVLSYVDAFLGSISRGLVWEPYFQKFPDSLNSVFSPAWPCSVSFSRPFGERHEGINVKLGLLCAEGQTQDSKHVPMWWKDVLILMREFSAGSLAF